MSENARLAEELAAILASEESLYLEMRDLLQAEREHMARLDADALEAGVRRKQVLADEGQLLESCRRDLASRLAERLGLPSERPTLSSLCEELGREGEELRRIHSRIAALVGAVHELLRANESLAGAALGRVQGTLRLLGRVVPEQVTYSRSGPPAPGERAAGRLLRQAV